MRVELRGLLAVVVVVLAALGVAASPVGARPAVPAQEMGEYTRGLEPASDFAGNTTSSRPGGDKLTDKLEEYGIEPVYVIAGAGFLGLVLLFRTTRSKR